MSGRANEEDIRLKVEGREQDVDFVAFGACWQFRGLWLLLPGCARAGYSLWHSGLPSFGCRAPTSGSETILFDCRQSYPHILTVNTTTALALPLTIVVPYNHVSYTTCICCLWTY